MARSGNIATDMSRQHASPEHDRTAMTAGRVVKCTSQGLQK